MWYKVCGVVFVVLSGVLMAYRVRRRYQSREQNLGYFITALQAMHTHIDFCGSWLSEIFYEIAHLPIGDVAQTFQKAYERCQEGQSPAEAFLQAMEEDQKKLGFLPEDCRSIQKWAQNMGKSDRLHEGSQIEATIHLLESQKEKAGQSVQKEGKLASSFCIIISILLVVLFL